MDLKHLASFIAVAEEGQLGRAAARLHLSQPPLSRHIQSLESELGVQLFTRTASGMALTQAGHVLLEDARNIGWQVQAATERVKSAGAGRFGQLAVGVYGSSIFGATSQILTRFRTRHPEVALNVHYAQTPAQLQALRRGQVEIVFERMVPHEDDVVVRRVCRERLYVALHQGHALATEPEVGAARLRDELFLVGTEVTASSKVVEICKSAGFFPRLAAPSTSVVTATLLAATGMGVSLVPESMTNVHFPGVVYRPLAAEAAFMDLHCFYLKRELSPILALMLDEVDEAFGAGPEEGGQGV
jgi:DNA-binding transcriptional LysR family regulator